MFLQCRPGTRDKMCRYTILLLLGLFSNETVAQTTEATESTPCFINDQEMGTCVRYYLCNDTFDFENTELLYIRINTQPCPLNLDVCCRVPGTPSPPVADTREGCGWRNPKGVDIATIDTESEAKFGEFPWVVAILSQYNESSSRYIGSGTLIDRRVVLTTAHQVSEGMKLTIRAGEWDTQTESEIHPHQERDVESVVIHKDYNDQNRSYDIALLFLSQPVDLGLNIRVACLPPTKKAVQTGARCFTTGWGKDKFEKKGLSQVILKKAEMPALAREDCLERLRKTELGSSFELHSTFMCAGGELDKDSCRGDGGAALVCPIESQQDRFVQHGMAAWGVGCGRQAIPSVFVDVSELRSWIDEEVLKKGIKDVEYAKY